MQVPQRGRQNRVTQTDKQTKNFQTMIKKSISYVAPEVEVVATVVEGGFSLSSISEGSASTQSFDGEEEW